MSALVVKNIKLLVRTAEQNANLSIEITILGFHWAAEYILLIEC